MNMSLIFFTFPNVDVCAICTYDLNYSSRPYYLAYHGTKQGSKQIKVCGKCTLNREKIPELCDQLTFIDMRKRIVSEKEINQKINLWEFFSALKN